MTAVPEEEILKYHMDVLSSHNATLFETLIQPHHIVSDNLKEIEFDEGYSRGYFARKDKAKYWIGEKTFNKLPIRVNQTQELKHKDDVILVPLKPAIFRITPTHSMTMRKLIDDFVPFKHTHPDNWLLMKMICISSYIGKTFMCIATEPNFGKSSSFMVLNSITSMCPVFKPRSVPGVLNKITGIGNIVFDEAHESGKDVRDIMEEFTLSIGGGASIYINGAMKSTNTRNKYPCQLQSITFLYNNLNCYKEPEKKYFEVIFSNNKAMDNRLLKMKLNGELKQTFMREFDIRGIAEKYKMYYIQLAKELEYLREYKQTGQYERKYATRSILTLKGRRRVVYEEVTWVLDNYCSSQEEYDKFTLILDQSIIDYKDMVSPLMNIQPDVDVEDIPDDSN